MYLWGRHPINLQTLPKHTGMSAARSSPGVKAAGRDGSTQGPGEQSVTCQCLLNGKSKAANPRLLAICKEKQSATTGQDQEPYQLAALMHTPDEWARFCSPEMQG